MRGRAGNRDSGRAAIMGRMDGTDEGWEGAEFDDVDVIGSSGRSGADARDAGDDAVAALDKITAQMSGGEHRPEQQEMCRAVAEALATGTHLVVQAGTGTGKSLAYLVPAALSGQKVVVATATKALQDQLRDKDLPLVESGLGLPAPLDYAVLKGRSNYICRQRVAEVGSGGIQAELGDQGSGRADEPDWEAPEAGAAARSDEGDASPPEGVVEQVRQLVAWSQTSRTGDRADLSFEPSDRAWNMLERGAAGVPGRVQLPLGRELLRRGGARPGRGGRHRRRQHPPLRRPSGQRRRRAARARGRGVRRGAPARGGHDVEPRRGAHPGTLPHPGDGGPLARGATGLGPARLARRGRRPARHVAGGPGRGPGAPGRASGRRRRRRRRRGPLRPVGARRRRQPPGDRRVAAGWCAAQLRLGRRRRPRQGEPQDPHAAGGGAPGRGPAPARRPHRQRGGVGRRHAAQRAASGSPPSTSGRRCRECSGARSPRS